MWGRKKANKVDSSIQKSVLLDRRSEKVDRRSFGPPTKFPFIDTKGKVIKVDRRAVPDRRINNIEVKEDHLSFDMSRFDKSQK